ncbi:putrescine-ornithine antiporter [uncultured Veillonella sp.]|uniref:putrescine-ornithine antiporter n=1 Tax=uncultured Veillonella sp. TaxID=159268 RepID=UPI0025E258EF|nr:putrescine-ornithine antiporter [uncultured Veillonella sp.]MDY3974201.1 putrescine-ornithine antiporter [Veillonella caviae]
MSENKNKMSVMQLTILTAVNMMGSGIIMLPTKLAQVGALSIVSWLITALGSMALAYAFAKCGMYSRRSGGMGGYAEYSFGKAGNFLANYTYGVSLLIANIAIAISAVGYGATFMNADLSPFMTGMWTIFTLWLATVLNFGGASITGKVSGVTVWGVIAPVFVISTAGWFFFSGDMYMANWNVNNLPFGEAATSSIAMTLWAFLGLESACANADAVDNPEKNVPKAVLGGTLGAAIIYILSTNIMFGIVPAAELANSSAPFGLAFAKMFNPTIGQVVMGLMVMSCFGSLLGWQFTIANVFKQSSDVGYFPKLFSKVTSKEAPIVGMVTITIIQSLMSLMTISPSLNEQFETLVNLAVVTNIIPYLLSMGAIIVIMKSADKLGSELSTTTFIAFIGSLYSLYALYASGFEAMTYGSIVTFVGWTLYGFISDRFDLDSNKKYHLENK